MSESKLDQDKALLRSVIQYLKDTGNSINGDPCGAIEGYIERLGYTGVTLEDMRNVSYFITEKGDAARWTHWEEKRAAIFRCYPALEYALQHEALASDLLRLAVKEIDEAALELEEGET